jgi:beta-glucosidase
VTSAAGTAFGEAVARVRSGGTAEAAAGELLALLEPHERLELLDGDQPFWPGMPQMMGEGYNLEPIVAGAVERLGVPGLRFSDGPRGAVIGRSTAFPVPMARGATWDPELEERIGAAIGAEIRAQGGNFFGGVCINLLRHPAWGRAQETYGEQPLVLGAMGAALTRGAQRHVMACVKHYACNSMENARFRVDVRVDESTLHEVYLPHFRAVVDAGVAAVMSAYNAVNGQWCGQSPELLTGVLRDEWGFSGVVVSDFIWGLRDPVGSLAAGLDVEMPFAQQRAGALPQALADGRASQEDVDRAAVRVLATQLRFAADLPDEAPGRDVVTSEEHRALAREAAAQAMVLLENDPVDGVPVLPLDAASLRRLAVVGRLADLPNTGDHGSSDVRAPHVVTPLEGLRHALPGVDVVHVADDSPAAAGEAVAQADAAVVVVGFTAEDEGEYVGSFDPELAVLYPPSDDPDALDDLARVWEAGPQSVGGDRDTLRLRASDEALVRAVAAANPRTVVVVVAGSAVVVEAWRPAVPAILLAWYAGMEGGHALADVLLGAEEPAGRLPFAVPVDERHLPPFDKDASAVVYDRWFGQRQLDRDGRDAAFPLGFGLGWTTFAHRDLQVDLDDGGLSAAVTVTNTGDRPGRSLTLVHASRALDDVPGVERLLLGFARAQLAPGESRVVRVRSDLAPLTTRTGRGQWQVRSGTYRIDAGAHAGERAVTTVVELL